jgi:hypothetical protein
MVLRLQWCDLSVALTTAHAATLLLLTEEPYDSIAISQSDVNLVLSALPVALQNLPAGSASSSCTQQPACLQPRRTAPHLQ